MLRGTIRRHVTLRRRAFREVISRCRRDLSHEPADSVLLTRRHAQGNGALHCRAIAGG